MPKKFSHFGVSLWLNKKVKNEVIKKIKLSIMPKADFYGSGNPIDLCYLNFAYPFFTLAKSNAICL